VKLGQIASIRLGYSFRSKLQPMNEGNFFVLSMKDLNHSGNFELSKLPRVYLKKINSENFLQQNDLLLKSRGRLYDAVLIEEKVEDVIISSPLLRITLKTTQVLPSYLVWYLNHMNTQKNLLRNIQGTSVQMVPKQALEELEVFFPSLEKQHSIAEIEKMAKRERFLLEQIQKKQNKLRECILFQLAQPDKYIRETVNDR